MIKSFSRKGLEDYFFDGTKKGILPNHANRIGDILDRLDAATNIGDMDYPGSRLHLLKPIKKGIWSTRVSGNWRITFKFKDGDVYDVDYMDYH